MNKFHASQQNCKEKILSEDYWDFILLPNRSREVLGIDGGEVCMLDMDFDYDKAYVNRSDLEPLTIERYWYNSIPNCYGLLDMDALEEAGYKFLSAEVAYIPQTMTSLPDEESIAKMEKLIDMLEENDDVQAVWHNWEMPEE